MLLKRFERGAGAEEEEKKIALELLDGRREEMYWECVPEKVRALAVQRSQAQAADEGRQGDGDAAVRVDVEDPSRENGVRKRRRRR